MDPSRTSLYEKLLKDITDECVFSFPSILSLPRSDSLYLEDGTVYVASVSTLYKLPALSLGFVCEAIHNALTGHPEPPSPPSFASSHDGLPLVRLRGEPSMVDVFIHLLMNYRYVSLSVHPQQCLPFR